jgi:hypothetical protein
MRNIYHYTHETTVFMGYIVLHLFYSCNLYSMHMMLLATINVCNFVLVFSEVRVQCPVWLFSVVLQFVLSRCVAEIFSELF